LLIAILALSLGLGLFACTARSSAFDMDRFFEALHEANTPAAIADLLLDDGLLGHRGVVPDEAMLLYVQALQQIAREHSDDENPPALFIARMSNDTQVLLICYETMLQAMREHNQLSTHVETWLELLIIEQTTPPTAGGALMIDYPQLISRLRAWEAFEHNNASFANALHGLNHFSAGYSRQLLSLFLLGSENSTTHVDGNITPELRTALELFLFSGEHTNSVYFQGIDDAYNIWRRNDWQFNNTLHTQLAAITQRAFDFPLPTATHPFGGAHGPNCC